MAYLQQEITMKKSFIFILPALAFALCGTENFIPVEDTEPGSWFLRSIRHSRPQLEKGFLEKLDKLDPYPERARCARLYNRMLDEKFISNRAEDAAIEKALNWKSGDFTWHNNKYYARPGCTSWIIAPDASSTGTYIVQKNRDYRRQNLLSLRLYRSAPGRYKVISVSDLWTTGSGAAMNEKGLMIVQNDPASREPHPRKISTSSVTVMRYVAEHCATLDEAVATIKEFYAKGICRSGSIYLLA